MTFKEAYDITVPIKKRKEEKYNTWVAYVVRPISVLCTLPFINRKVKPTTITAISILACIIGAACLIFAPNMQIKIVGWLGIFIWSILDGVDGNLARCQNKCSALGDLWDTMGGYIAMIMIYYSAGIVAYFDTNTFEFGNKYLWLICGGTTAIFSIFPRLILHKKKSSEIKSEKVVELTDTSNFSLLKSIAGNITSPSGIMQVFFLVSIIFHLLNIFSIIYLVINFGIMCISLRGLLRE